MRLLDSLPTAVLVVARGGCIALANDRAAELLERDRASLEGAPIDSVLVPLSCLASAHRGERASARITLSSGREVDIGFKVTALGAEEPQGEDDPLRGALVCSFQDITPVLRLREERDRLLKLATVGEVLPSILHELRNPLSAVATTLELLIEEHESGPVREDLHGVLRELRRALLGLDGIGVLGRDVRSRSLGAVDHAVRESTAVLTARAARGGVTLDTDMGSMPLLHVDTAVVRAVVFNLVMNAIHACREGDRIRVSGRIEGDDLVIAVADTGPGMTPEVRAQCTEMFFTTKRSGSGLGLPLCAQLAESAGGALEVESESGRGTRVTWRVPVPPAPAEAQKQEIPRWWR